MAFYSALNVYQGYRAVFLPSPNAYFFYFLEAECKFFDLWMRDGR
jgi:hypothetical protein